MAILKINRPDSLEDLLQQLGKIRARGYVYIVGHNTIAYKAAGPNMDPTIRIRLHGNTIAIIDHVGVQVFDGGWQSVTTKDRLNQLLPVGWVVFQKNYSWYIQHRRSGTVCAFTNGVQVTWAGEIVQPAEERRFA